MASTSIFHTICIQVGRRVHQHPRDVEATILAWLDEVVTRGMSGAECRVPGYGGFTIQNKTKKRRRDAVTGVIEDPVLLRTPVWRPSLALVARIEETVYDTRSEPPVLPEE